MPLDLPDVPANGLPALDLAGILVGVGDLLTHHPAVEELDLNPLIASADRLVAVDALVVVNPETTNERGEHGHGS